MPGCNVQYQEFMIVCVCANIVHFISLLASQSGSFSTQQVNGMVHYIFYSPIMLALCLMLLVTCHALNYAGTIGLGLSVSNGIIMIPYIL